MKILQKILNIIAGILIVLVALILLSATNPDISRKIGQIMGTISSGVDRVKEVFGPEDGETESQEENGSDSGTETMIPPVSVLPPVELIIAPVDGLSPDTVSTGGYEQPSELPQNVPAGMAERTGFVPIQSTGEEATSEDENIGYGETGDGLSFDPAIYPYYAMLNEDTKTLYRQIYANMNALQAEFAPLLDGTSPDQLRNAFTAVCNDHPELFWVNTSYSYAFNGAGSVAAVGLSYNRTASSLEEAKQRFSDQADYFLANARNLQSDYEKEILVHDALLNFCTYDLNADMNQSAYSALVNGNTVCAGYAKGFQYLMQQLGIPVYYCTGYAGENHAWDIICLEGEYYNVDLTWDDTDPSTYNYFNGTDQDFGKDHARTDLSVNLPPCNGETYRLLLASDTSSSPQDVIPGAGTVAVNEEGTGNGQENGSSSGDSQDTGSQGGDIGSSDGADTSGSGDPRNGENHQDTPDYSNVVVSNMSDYYTYVRDILMNTSEDPVTFSMLAQNNDMYNRIVESYNNGTYMNAFMKEVGQQRGAKGVQFEVQPEELPDGTCRMNHTFTFSY